MTSLVVRKVRSGRVVKLERVPVVGEVIGGGGLKLMPILTGTRLSLCPKCGRPLKRDISHFSAMCECGFSASYGKLPNGKYYLIWVDKK